MHGGLFSKDGIKLDDIRATERYGTVPTQAYINSFYSSGNGGSVPFAHAFFPTTENKVDKYGIYLPNVKCSSSEGKSCKLWVSKWGYRYHG